MHLRLDPGVHRLRSRSSTVEVSAHLARVGWAVSVVDVSEASDKAALLRAFAVGLRFPAWVGRNWDALEDALRDLSWWQPGERGRAIVVVGAGRLGDDLEGDWRTLCEVLVDATEHWRSTVTPLGVLVRGRALG
jgi:RNAse (barnase) inhibitor barstar